MRADRILNEAFKEGSKKDTEHPHWKALEAGGFKHNKTLFDSKKEAGYKREYHFDHSNGSKAILKNEYADSTEDRTEIHHNGLQSTSHSVADLKKDIEKAHNRASGKTEHTADNILMKRASGEETKADQKLKHGRQISQPPAPVKSMKHLQWYVDGGFDYHWYYYKIGFLVSIQKQDDRPYSEQVKSKNPAPVKWEQVDRKDVPPHIASVVKRDPRDD